MLLDLEREPNCLSGCWAACLGMCISQATCCTRRVLDLFRVGNTWYCFTQHRRYTTWHWCRSFHRLRCPCFCTTGEPSARDDPAARAANHAGGALPQVSHEVRNRHAGQRSHTGVRNLPACADTHLFASLCQPGFCCTPLRQPACRCMSLCQLVSTCLPACLPTFLSACLPACLPISTILFRNPHSLFCWGISAVQVCCPKVFFMYVVAQYDRGEN